MMKILISIMTVLVLSACSGNGKNGQLFIGHPVAWIEDTSDTQKPPVFELKGDWELSAGDYLRIVLINGTERDLINAGLKLEGAGSLEGKKILRGKDTLEWTIRIPATPADSGILGSMKGMRATPFSIDGITSTLKNGKLNRILISFDKSLKGVRLGIKEITVEKGEPAKAPQWFSLDEQAFFPFIDKYGQFMHKSWPGKTGSDSDLVADRKNEILDMEQHPGPADRSRYGGWLKGEKQETSTHFRVRKLNGKWWMVDPDGYLFWSNGVVRVTPSSAVTIIDNREKYFAELPDSSAEFYRTKDDFLYQYYKNWGIKKTFDFSAANLRLKYGPNWREAYRHMVEKRLANWGMNTISAGSDKDIYRSIPVPYCDRIELKTQKIEGAPAHLNVIRDPFHPDFETGLTQQLLDRKEELESAWCYGYFIDNKLAWGNHHDLGRWVLRSPATQPAKKILVESLQKKYNSIEALNKAWTANYPNWEQLLASQQEPPAGSIQDCSAFSTILIDTYFKKIKQVLHQTAPGKLYLGCRYVSVNERVLKIAADHCDVFTFDLFIDSLDDFKLPNGIDKPVLIGEFHFGAQDRGLFHPGLNSRPNQDARALALEKYLRSALHNPYVVGTAWHQFSDQATTGRFDGENFQDGLTDVCDRIYPETIRKLKEVGSQLYQIRAMEK